MIRRLSSLVARVIHLVAARSLRLEDARLSWRAAR